MGTLRRIGDLVIDEDPALQQKVWAAQRLGWAVMCLGVLAALSGVLGGPGPLAGARAAAPGLLVEYERFARAHATTEVRITFSPSGPEPWLEVAESLLEEVHVRSVLPPPERVEAGDGTLRYVFAGRGGAAGALTVTMYLEPEATGRRRGAVRAGGHAVTLAQFVYP